MFCCWGQETSEYKMHVDTPNNHRSLSHVIYMVLKCVCTLVFQKFDILKLTGGQGLMMIVEKLVDAVAGQITVENLG